MAKYRERRQSFNPLPSPKQGETYCTTEIEFPKYVSIRSPHRSKGRRPVPPAEYTEYAIKFQSAPLTEARGDLPVYGRDRLGMPYVVSIRSPHRSKGRPVRLELL